MKTTLAIVIGWWLLLEIIVRYAQYTSNKKEQERIEKERKFKEQLRKQIEEINRQNQEQYKRMWQDRR